MNKTPGPPRASVRSLLPKQHTTGLLLPRRVSALLCIGWRSPPSVVPFLAPKQIKFFPFSVRSNTSFRFCYQLLFLFLLLLIPFLASTFLQFCPTKLLPSLHQHNSKVTTRTPELSDTLLSSIQNFWVRNFHFPPKEVGYHLSPFRLFTPHTTSLLQLSPVQSLFFVLGSFFDVLFLQLFLSQYLKPITLFLPAHRTLFFRYSQLTSPLYLFSFLQSPTRHSCVFLSTTILRSCLCSSFSDILTYCAIPPSFQVTLSPMIQNCHVGFPGVHPPRSLNTLITPTPYNQKPTGRLSFSDTTPTFLCNNSRGSLSLWFFFFPVECFCFQQIMCCVVVRNPGCRGP